MDVLLLGTGASDGIPAVFGNSRVSEHARTHRGKNIRSRTGALVDGWLKIDLGPDTWHQVATQGLDPTAWGAVLITHSHEDHLCASELQYCLQPFTDESHCPFAIYGNDRVLEIISSRYPDWPFELIRTQSYEPFTIAGTRVTPLHAYHKLEEDAHNFLMEARGKTFLYATDTGLWEMEVWEFLAQHQLDGLVLEATDGLNKTDYYGHLSLAECISQVERLREHNILKPDALVATTHISHLGGLTHDELAQMLAPHRILAGYDGLNLTI